MWLENLMKLNYAFNIGEVKICSSKKAEMWILMNPQSLSFEIYGRYGNPLHDSRKIAHSVIRKNISKKGWEGSEKPSFLKAIFIIVDERTKRKQKESQNLFKS